MGASCAGPCKTLNSHLIGWGCAGWPRPGAREAGRSFIPGHRAAPHKNQSSHWSGGRGQWRWGRQPAESAAASLKGSPNQFLSSSLSGDRLNYKAVELSR